MTINVQAPKVSYIGDGVNATFAFVFRILENDDLKVELDGSEQTENVDYTIENLTDLGGDVVFVVVPPSNSLIEIARLTDQDQTTSYTPFDPFPAKTHELALDKLTMIVQELTTNIPSAGGFDPDANHNTTGNWINTGDWSFLGLLTYNGFEVATVNDIPDHSAFTIRSVNENITGSWSFNSGITLNQSAWPNNRGNNNQILKTDGAGTLTWIDQAGGAGFDPSANYNTTGDWTNDGNWQFSLVITLDGGAHMANGQSITARNQANDETFDLLRTIGDIPVFGDQDANAQFRFADQMAFRNDLGEDHVTFVKNTLGSILLEDRLGSQKKAAFRNPQAGLALANGASFPQESEGQIAVYIDTGGSLVVDQLEQATTMTFDHAGSGPVTLTEGAGVTIEWRDGSGSPKLGNRTVQANSIVQLHWRTVALVIIWGVGVS